MTRGALVLFLVLLYSSVSAQEKFTALENLRPVWTTYDGDDYKRLDRIPFTGLNTIYFELDPRAHAGNFLLLASDRPYFLFVDGLVLAEYQGEAVIDIDSLARRVYGAPYRIAIHQKDINEQDLRTQVMSLQPSPPPAEDGTAARPYSYFRDFVVVAGLIVILLFLLVFRLHAKLAADYFSIARIFSVREVDDGQTSTRLTSSSNIQFYILCSMMIGLYLMIIFRNLPPQYALPLRFQATDFWMIAWQWMKLSAVIFLVLLLKIVIVFSLTRLFGMRGMARFHFFNWIRLLLVIFGAGTTILFMYFISHGNRPHIFVFFLSLVLITLAAWIVVAFLKLGGRTGHTMFHLFSYLCATEIIPLLITAKVLYQ